MQNNRNPPLCFTKPCMDAALEEAFLLCKREGGMPLWQHTTKSRHRRDQENSFVCRVTVSLKVSLCLECQGYGGFHRQEDAPIVCRSTLLTGTLILKPDLSKPSLDKSHMPAAGWHHRHLDTLCHSRRPVWKVLEHCKLGEKRPVGHGLGRGT